MSDKNNKKKEMKLYEILELDIAQKFYPKKKKELSSISSFYLSKEE